MNPESRRSGVSGSTISARARSGSQDIRFPGNHHFCLPMAVSRRQFMTSFQVALLVYNHSRAPRAVVEDTLNRQ
jgi:hypothetical protein